MRPQKSPEWGARSALDERKEVVLECIGQLDAAQVEAPCPPFGILGAERIEHVGEAVCFLFGIAVGRAAAELVEFLVVVVLHRARGGLHIAGLFAAVVVAAARGTVAMGGLDGFVAPLGEFGNECGHDGQDGQEADGNEQDVHERVMIRILL